MLTAGMMAASSHNHIVDIGRRRNISGRIGWILNGALVWREMRDPSGKKVRWHHGVVFFMLAGFWGEPSLTIDLIYSV